MIIADIFFGVARVGEVLVDTTLLLGPGLLVVAAGWAGSCAWDRIRARAARRAAARAEFDALLRARRNARRAAADPRVDTLPGVIDATYLQLEGMYAAPDYTREGDR